MNESAVSEGAEPMSASSQSASSEPLIPLWLKAGIAGGNATQAVVSADLACSFSLFAEWSAPSVIERSPELGQGVWRGPIESDWLVVSFMPNAIPGHDIRDWVEAPLAIIGFPEPAVQPTPELLRWDLGSATSGTHTFTGLARHSGSIARLYTLLVREHRFAWKVFLSIASSAGGGNELACMREDDSRAAVVFGDLELAVPAH